MKQVQTKIENYQKRNFAFLQMANASAEWTGYAKVIAAYGEDEAARLLADELKGEGAPNVRVSGLGHVLEDGSATGRMWMNPATLPLDFEDIEANGPGSYFIKIPVDEIKINLEEETALFSPPPPYEIFWTDGRVDPETGILDWFPLENNEPGEWDFNSFSSARLAAGLLLRLPMIDSIMIVRDGEAIVTQSKDHK